jgi:hypothetical protein
MSLDRGQLLNDTELVPIISPAWRTLYHLQSTIYTITLEASPAITQPVDLAVNGLYDAQTALSAHTIPTDGMAVLMVTSTLDTEIGLRTFTVTASSGGYTGTDQATLEVKLAVYMPIIMRDWPPLPFAPTLYSIANSDGDGSYMVSWTEQPERRAYSYLAQEASNSDFTTELKECMTTLQSCIVLGNSAGIYYYRVRGENMWGYGEWSNTQTATVLPPGTPTLDPIDNSDGDWDYTVTWNATALATSYKLIEDTDPAFGSPTEVYNGPDQSWSAVAQAPGTYYYRVRAFGPTGKSDWSNTRSVTAPSPPTTGDVNIIQIHYEGSGSQEPDEYVAIRNDASFPIQLQDWRLWDIANHLFVFPNFVIQPGQECRVYTNEYHSLYCGFNYENEGPIWDNGGDCAALRNSAWSIIDTYCYPLGR